MSHTALLVIDFQYGLIEGKQRATRADEVLANLNTLIAHARAAGHPVIFIQHDHPQGLPHGSEAWQLHPGLARLASDIVVEKQVCDSFAQSTLAEHLTRLGVTDLWIGGYATEFCVDTCVRHAGARGYNLTVIADAHTTGDRPHLDGESIIRHHNWVWANMSVPGKPLRVLPLAEFIASA